MYSDNKVEIDREYLQKLRELIDQTEKTGKDFVTELGKISLTKKYKVDNLSGVGQSKVQRIAEYMSDNGVYRSCDLLNHDLTSISGVGQSAEEKIKDRIRKTKDKITEFK